MNILLIVIESLRPDHLGTYGYFRSTSACLDQLVREGIVFDSFRSQSTSTLESCASLITGHDPTLFPAGDLYLGPPGGITLAEGFRQRGFATCSVDGLFSLPSHPALFHRGYQHAIDPSSLPSSPPEVTAESVTREAIHWLNGHRDLPFFLFLHYWDPHPPFNQPPVFKTLFDHSQDELTARAVEVPSGKVWVPHAGSLDRLFPESLERMDRYDGEIAYADAEIHRLLGAMRDFGLYSDSLIVVTSSHGMDLMEHHDPFGHQETYDHTLRVPLILKPPYSHTDLPKGMRISQPCTHRDLFPTLLHGSLMPKDRMDSNAAPSDLADSMDLTRLILTRGLQEDRYILSAGQYREGPGSKGFLEISLVKRGRKLIARIQDTSHIPSLEFYDLTLDPMETQDLSRIKPDLLKEQLEDLQAAAPWFMKG